MTIFEWKGFDQKGKRSHGVVDADSAKDARTKLRRRGFLVTETAVTGSPGKPKKSVAQKPRSAIQEKIAKTLEAARGRGKGSTITKRRMEEVSTFTRQLSTLLKAGIPITEALHAIIEQTTNKRLSLVWREIREQITQGMATADSLAMHPDYFDELYVSMVRSGEAAGRLDEVLERLSEFMQGQSRVRNRVAAAMAYPIIMLLIGFLVVAMLMVMVVPKITTMLESRGLALPLPTRILQGASNFLVSWWWLVVVGVIFSALIFNLWYASEKGRLTVDRLMLRLPLFGDLITKQAVSRFAQTFATLLRSGVPVVRGLEVTKTVLGNRLLENTIVDVREKILEGADIAGPIKTSAVFPPLVGYMIAVGEQSGELDTMMHQVGVAYDEEVSLATQKFTSLIEPLLIVFLAILVGFIVLAILWPVMGLSQQF